MLLVGLGGGHPRAAHVGGRWHPGGMLDDDPGRDALLAALRHAREHVLAAVAPLTDAQLRTATLPSGWTPVGLVRHLTFGDERYWFEVVIAGGPLDWWPADDPALDDGRPADWRVAPDESSAAVVAAYRAAIAASDRILAGVRLDAAPLAREAEWPAGAFVDVRSVVLHVLTDTLTHAGHLDAALELLDRRQRLVL